MEATTGAHTGIHLINTSADKKIGHITEGGQSSECPRAPLKYASRQLLPEGRPLGVGLARVEQGGLQLVVAGQPGDLRARGAVGHDAWERLRRSDGRVRGKHVADARAAHRQHEGAGGRLRPRARREEAPAAAGRREVHRGCGPAPRLPIYRRFRLRELANARPAVLPYLLPARRASMQIFT